MVLVDVDIVQGEAEMDERLRQAQPNCGALSRVQNSKDAYGMRLTIRQEHFWLMDWHLLKSMLW